MKNQNLCHYNSKNYQSAKLAYYSHDEEQELKGIEILINRYHQPIEQILTRMMRKAKCPEANI